MEQVNPKDSDPFDLENVYDTEISPLMIKIIAICKSKKMPMIASFCFAKGKYADDPDGVEYCTTYIPRGTWVPSEFSEAKRAIRKMSRGSCLAMTIIKGE